MKLRKGILGTSLGLLLLGGTYASAGTTFVSYNTTVGSFNGSGYTGYQTKVTEGAAAALRVAEVGGGYTVDAREISSSSNGDWVRNLGSSRNVYLYNKHSKGESVRVQFSNDLSTPVSVQVRGNWASN